MTTAIEAAAARLRDVVRTARLVESAQACLAAEPVDPAAIEAVLREIYANFSADTLPPELAPLRAQLVDRRVAA